MNAIRSDISRFNLLYIFVCIIWPPLQLFVLGVDGAGRSIVFLSILAVLLNLSQLRNHKEVFATPAFICWVALLCFSLMNSLTKGFTSEYGTFYFLKVNFFQPFIFLVVAMIELHRNRKRALKVICFALGVYIFIGLPFIGLSDRDRMEVAGIGNMYSLHSVAFLFVSTVLCVERQIRRRYFIAIALAVSAIILLSGTRKAFGAEVIILIGFVFNLGRKGGPMSILRFIVLGGLLLAGVNYALDNSVVGERIDETIEIKETAEDGYVIIGVPPTDVQLVENSRVNDMVVALLDDRAIQYELGLALSRKNFWTGIGLTNFVEVSGYPYRLHTEYIVHLCENGIIGFSLLILFYVFIIIALRKNKTKETAQGVNMVLFGLLALLFINFTTWSYSEYFAMIVYAVVLTYASKNTMIDVQ